MNNNNRNQNNNRRRGRSNRNQGGGGGSQANRIDSRARGNAPQLLEKYKKQAEDSYRNGDRVQAEYYLQFADHYFRVIADNRNRQDEPRGEQRAGGRNEREQDDFDNELESEGDDRRFDAREREPRDNQPRDGHPRDGQPRDGQPRDGQSRDSQFRDTQPRERAPRERDNRDREPRESQGRDSQPRERDSRNDRVRPESRTEPRKRPRRDAPTEDGASEASEGAPFEADDNPFVRDTREPSEERSKRRSSRARQAEEVDTGIDASALPPAFSANDSGAADENGEAAAPRPRRKRSDGGTLSAVG